MDISIDQSHDADLRDLASVLQLTTTTDNATARALLRQWGNPQDAAIAAVGRDTDLGSWMGEARRTRYQAIRAVTVLDEDYPTSWIDDPAAPAVLWVRNQLTQPKRTRVAVFGGLNSTPAATAPGGAVGAWVGLQGVITTALVDDRAGASALKAARLTSRTKAVVPVMATGLMAPLPTSRVWPAPGWASFPAESAAPLTSTDDSTDAIDRAARQLLSRVDLVILTSISPAIDISDTIRTATVPVFALCTPTRWLSDLVDAGRVTRIYNLQELPDLRTSRAVSAA